MLKIMTYNIHSGKNLQGKNTFSKILNLIELHSPDILTIQEINENRVRGYQLSELSNSLGYNYHFGSHVKIKDGEYGIGTFTALPIIKKNHILLPSLGEQRGLLQTTLKINNKCLDIFNTHLGLNTLERIKQFNIIEKIIKEINNQFIIFGDFNTTVPILDSSLFKDASTWNNSQNNIPTLINSNKKIDYILVSKKINTLFYEVLSVSLSDHYPLIAEIKIP